MLEYVNSGYMFNIHMSLRYKDLDEIDKRSLEI